MASTSSLVPPPAVGRRHVAILEALEARDPERAAQAMREHANEAEAWGRQ
ncbi:MAG: FCD domain-containing protein [Acidimicrobiia bacterium]